MGDSPVPRPPSPEPDLRLAEVAERSPDAFWIATADESRMLYASPAYAELWGRPVSELYESPAAWFDAIHPEDRERVRRAWRAVGAEGKYEELFRVVRPDGSQRWIRDRGFSIRPGEDQTPRIGGYASDVTALKRATESSRVLASAVEQARDSIFITTSTEPRQPPIIVFANSAFTALTGFEESEVLGRSPNLLEGPRSDAAVLQRLREQLGRAEPFTGELVSYRRDASAFLAHWEVAPVRDEHGHATHAVTILRDITARKRAQAELLEAKALAEAADHSKSAFLASMSHELRTPLNAIIGFSELLTEQSVGPLNQRQEKYLQNVLSAGRSLLDLIDQVLDLTRMDVGRMVVNPTRFNVADVLADVHSLVRALADRKRLSIEIEVPEGFGPVRADARKVKQIVYSLLSSLIRTAAEGGGLRMAARDVAADGGDWFEIAVSRTGGPGEPEMNAAAEGEASPPVYGAEHPQSGLGLALSRKLVELHGGRLVTESGGDGSVTHRVTLPRHGGVLPQPPMGAPVQEGAGSGPLVLVVEDNPDAGDLLSLYLAEAGYSVARAFTGEEGILRARQLRPVAITMDSELPDLNGLDVMATLKQFPETSRIPAVVISVVDRRATPAAGGVSAWLVKPIDRHHFLAVLDRAIQGAERADAPAPAAMAPEDPAR